jgi:hypothetical protein
LIFLKVGIPSNIGNKNFSDWDGIINLGFQYSNLRKNNLYLNFYINYDRLKETQFESNSTQNLYKIGLGLQYNLEFSESVKMYPKFGIGYAYQNLNYSQNLSTVDHSGLNLLFDIDLLYKLNEKLFIGVGLRYDFVKLAGYEINTGYLTHIHTITPNLQTVIKF